MVWWLGCLPALHEWLQGCWQMYVVGFDFATCFWSLQHQVYTTELRDLSRIIALKVNHSFVSTTVPCDGSPLTSYGPRTDLEVREGAAHGWVSYLRHKKGCAHGMCHHIHNGGRHDCQRCPTSNSKQS